jgi:hypothetical protein
MVIKSTPAVTGASEENTVVDEPASTTVGPDDGAANAGELAFPIGGTLPDPKMDPEKLLIPRHSSNARLAWDPAPELLDVPLVGVVCAFALELELPELLRKPLSGPVGEVSTVHPAGNSL